MSYFLVLILSVLLVSASVLLKQHFILNPIPETLGIGQMLIKVLQDALISLYAWFSVLSTLIGGLMWAYIINKLELSVAYPMASMTYILMLVADYFIFGTPITSGKIIGILLIIIGILFIVK